MVIKYLRSVLSEIVANDPSPAEEPETEGTTESFETPNMEEVLRENQTADELWVSKLHTALRKHTKTLRQFELSSHRKEVDKSCSSANINYLLVIGTSTRPSEQNLCWHANLYSNSLL